LSKAMMDVDVGMLMQVVVLKWLMEVQRQDATGVPNAHSCTDAQILNSGDPEVSSRLFHEGM
jgi:hypothetical protein